MFLIPARSHNGRNVDAKTGPRISEKLNRQAFGHDIGELMDRGHEESDLLVDEVDVDLDVLLATITEKAGCHVNGANIVAVDNCHNTNRDMKLLKKMPKLTTLGDNMGHINIVLLHSGLEYEIVVWRLED